MRIIGVDFHAGQQTIAIFDTETKELVEKTLKHEGGQVREFYSALPHPVQVGIEASGSIHWFLELMEELGIDRQVGHPTEIRAAEPRKQKHDRRDAALLRHRHQWVRMRTRVQNTLQAIARSHGLRRGSSLWNQKGQHAIALLPLAPHAAHRRTELQVLYRTLSTPNRQARRAGDEPSLAASRGQTVADPSGSRARDGIGDGRVFRRAQAVRRRQGGGELRRYDPERIFQRRPTAAWWLEQARQSVATFSLV